VKLGVSDGGAVVVGDEPPVKGDGLPNRDNVPDDGPAPLPNNIDASLPNIEAGGDGPPNRSDAGAVGINVGDVGNACIPFEVEASGSSGRRVPHILQFKPVPPYSLLLLRQSTRKKGID
jgi:hypothetical protein